MNYALTIREHNIQAHLDVENEIQAKRNGTFTCILRVNNGNIVDSVIMEYGDARQYLVLKKIIIEEFTIPRTNGVGSGTDPLRSDNI